MRLRKVQMRLRTTVTIVYSEYCDALSATFESTSSSCKLRPIHIYARCPSAHGLFLGAEEEPADVELFERLEGLEAHAPVIAEDRPRAFLPAVVPGRQCGEQIRDTNRSASKRVFGATAIFN